MTETQEPVVIKEKNCNSYLYLEKTGEVLVTYDPRRADWYDSQEDAEMIVLSHAQISDAKVHVVPLSKAKRGKP